MEFLVKAQVILLQEDVLARYVYYWRHRRFATGKAGRGNTYLEQSDREESEPQDSTQAPSTVKRGDTLSNTFFQ